MKTMKESKSLVREIVEGRKGEPGPEGLRQFRILKNFSVSDRILNIVKAIIREAWRTLSKSHAVYSLSASEEEKKGGSVPYRRWKEQRETIFQKDRIRKKKSLSRRYWLPGQCRPQSERTKP